MKKYIVTVNGVQYEVMVEETAGNASAPAPVKKPEAASVESVKQAPPPKVEKAPDAAEGTKVNAPLPGTILKVLFAPGDTCNKGDALCILEAMKMENEIAAPCAGKIVSAVASGAAVNTGDLLFVIA